jgi:hypothetical protein
MLPDGRPATGADIGLVSSVAGLKLVPGGFSRDNVQSGGSLLRTDDQGVFRLPADGAIHRILVAHALGYAETTVAALTLDPEIYLQPWGRIEGTFQSGGQGVADREIAFQFGLDRSEVATEFGSYKARTDREGRFEFDQVPPGHHKLAEVIPMSADSDGFSGWRYRPLLEVEILPGQTTPVSVEGE